MCQCWVNPMETTVNTPLTSSNFCRCSCCCWILLCLSARICCLYRSCSSSCCCNAWMSNTTWPQLKYNYENWFMFGFTHCWAACQLTLTWYWKLTVLFIINASHVILCILLKFTCMWTKLHGTKQTTCCPRWPPPPPPRPPSLPPSWSSVCSRRNSRLSVHSPGTFTMELMERDTWAALSQVRVTCSS